MATFNRPTAVRGQYAQGAGSAPQTQSAPAGTFVPGTKVQVGSHRVVIDRYLSEGGFAHVYVVTLPRPVDGEEKAVLKRVAVPDKDHLANMRTEVETMKRLRGHKYIVKYIDSHASSLKAGGYEVFLLMEYCQGGGLIDFMNTRLQNRLTEPEILKIFTDVAEGVACMHYLKPVLLHRDLKIENVLISTNGKDKIFKLCDFGSAAPPRPAATSAAEGRLIEDDVQRHTTMQYRSPEMIDVYRKQPIDEKSDIWALGVFLYKLCYYTTPFEEVGQMAILNASFKYPGYPRFSDQLKLLIASMLREQPSQRPNIYQVLQKSCQMDGRELNLRDKNSGRTESERRASEALPAPKEAQSKAGATLSPPPKEAAAPIPDIAPMRRGRPSRPVSQHNSARPSPSPLRVIEGADPFAQLDSDRATASDEISHKFPSLDQFSLMTDKKSRFAFESESPKRIDTDHAQLSKRVTNALADEAFARPASPAKPKPAIPSKSNTVRSSEARDHSTSSELPSRGRPPTIEAKKPAMVSTGTMTSSSPHSAHVTQSVSERPIYRFPPRESGSSKVVPASKPYTARSPVTSTKSGSLLAGLLKDDAARSQPGSDTSTNSARPSMEGGRPITNDLDEGLSRSRSLDMRPRPASVNMGSGPTHIKDQGIKRSVLSRRKDFIEQDASNSDSDANIASDVDYLKVKEEEEKERTRLMKRNSSGSRHGKRASLPSIAISGTKNLLAGRFGDAFKKFESQGDQTSNDSRSKEEADILTPIAGSEATDLSEDRNGFDETEELSPEMRRELEKRQLEAEERRVASAAAEYRQKNAGRAGPPVSSKAASIQNRVQSLLQESERPVSKTATGYGHFTEVVGSPPPQVPQKSATFEIQTPSQHVQTLRAPVHDSRSVSAPAAADHGQRTQRPTAPPKPKALLQNLPNENNVAHSRANEMSNDFSPSDDWEIQFSKRYPSLTHLEMVETEIDTPRNAQLRTREI